MVAARLVGRLFVRLHQPRIVGEMVAGILIGPTVLGAATAEAVFPVGSVAFLEPLGTVALIAFTFLVRLQVPRPDLRLVTPIGVAVVVASVGIRPLLALVLDALLLTGALLAGGAAELIGIQSLSGGLLFGVAVPKVPGLAPAVAARLQQVVVVLGLPVFLAVSGLHTDLPLRRPEHLGAIALFVAAVAVAKLGVGAVAGRAVGVPTRDAGAVGVLLGCGGLVTLVVGLAARRLGLVTPSMQMVFVVDAILTTVATGPLLDRCLARR